MYNDYKELYNLATALYIKHCIEEIPQEQGLQLPTLVGMVNCVDLAFRNRYGNQAKIKIPPGLNDLHKI